MRHTISSEHPVVFIDGVCHLCQGAVRWIVPRDPAGRFRFASLQSKTAERLLAPSMRSSGLPDSVLVLENGRLYAESAAVLRIVRQLRWPWPALYVLIIIPRPLRDAVYRFVAKRRYRWFGRDDQCMLPAPGIRERFLEDQ